MLAKKKLLSAMAGLAMMAMPLSALAANHHNWNQNVPLHPQAAHAYQRRADRPKYAANQPGRYGWDNHSHNNGNSIRNPYAGWNTPPVFRERPVPPPPIYSYVPPYRQYAANPAWNRLNPPYAYNGNYGNGYGYAGGNLTLRDRLLQERAGAYQQLGIRERAGDRNGAHHLWNTIHSLDRQIARVNQSIN